MSGGYAIVYDEAGDFARKCNTELVDINPIDDSDIPTLKSLLNEHVQRTDSEKARKILSDFSECVTRFVKIIPGEYRRVLEAMKSVAAAE
jgi:glutamate synthase (ferredoxin)